MAAQSSAPWWRGHRGEWFVVGQVCLLFLLVFGPRTAPGLPAWPASIGRLSVGLGILLVATGGLWMLAGARALGRNLTPLPAPKASGHVVSTGAYGLVRHPSVLRGDLGRRRMGTLDAESADARLCPDRDRLPGREGGAGRALAVRSVPGYPAYQTRVRKLIPFVY